MSYIKEIEKRVNEYKETADVRLMKGLPIVIMFDGSAFSKFVKGLDTPYDQRLTDLMIEAAKFITTHTNARCGLVGSDEITIVLYEDNIESETMYNRRVQKLLSELPAKLSVRFNKLLPKYLPEKVGTEPYFDCKIWNTPSLEEAANCFFLREESIYKNAISMAAQKYFSHKNLEGVNGKEKQEMLYQKQGINFNDYPVAFKRGVYIQKRKVIRKFTTDELEKLPAKHQARLNPDLEIERTVVNVLELPKFSSITNRVDVIFNGAEPILRNVVDYISETTETTM